jgi:hypothetical protein
VSTQRFPLQRVSVLQGILGALVMPPMVFGAVYGVTSWSFRVNRYFGLACSLYFAFAGLAFVFSAYTFSDDIRRVSSRGGELLLYPMTKLFPKVAWSVNLELARRFQIAQFLPTVATFTAGWISLAYVTAKFRPSAYAHPEQITYWLMCKHYLWHVVDMIPLIDAWKNVHVEDPLIETWLWPGVLLIVFRLIIL